MAKEFKNPYLALEHGWGKTAEQKRKEQEYNRKYYEEHKRDKWGVGIGTNRPLARQKNVAEGGTGVRRRGDGLGTGPVGNTNRQETSQPSRFSTAVKNWGDSVSDSLKKHNENWQTGMDMILRKNDAQMPAANQKKKVNPYNATGMATNEQAKAEAAAKRRRQSNRANAYAENQKASQQQSYDQYRATKSALMAKDRYEKYKADKASQMANDRYNKYEKQKLDAEVAANKQLDQERRESQAAGRSMRRDLDNQFRQKSVNEYMNEHQQAVNAQRGKYDADILKKQADIRKQINQREQEMNEALAIADQARELGFTKEKAEEHRRRYQHSAEMIRQQINELNKQMSNLNTAAGNFKYNPNAESDKEKNRQQEYASATQKMSRINNQIRQNEKQIDSLTKQLETQQNAIKKMNAAARAGQVGAEKQAQNLTAAYDSILNSINDLEKQNKQLSTQKKNLSDYRDSLK